MKKNHPFKAAASLALLLTFACPIFAKPSFRTNPAKNRGAEQNQNQSTKRDSEISRIDSLKANKEDETMVALKNSKTDSLRQTDVKRYIAKVAEEIDKSASDDFERVKMIHDLICLTIKYDDDSYWSGDSPSQDSEDVFRSGYAVCEGFSSAFKRLCDELDITCRVVHGYARGVSADINNEKKTYSSNHAWNIVTIKGKDYIIDSTWDEGYMAEKVSVHEYSTDWLCPNPEHFIYSHYTDSAEDQLLPRKVSFSQFLELPSLEPNFFYAVEELKTDLKLINKCNGNFTIEYVEKEKQNLSCNILDIERNEKIPNLTFKQLTDDGTTRIMFSLPRAARYKVSFFQQDDTMEKSNYCGEMILDSKSAGATVFPKTYDDYGLDANGILLSPIEGPLERGKTYEFSVKSKYSDIEVKIDNNWYTLEAAGDGIYSKTIKIPSDAKTLKISVNNGTSESYWTLVSYTLK
ncbi:MAG: hypothetical protein IKP60_08670 [Treponema sp.]|nr:hypothetical protein [Treponema sp.]